MRRIAAKIATQSAAIMVVPVAAVLLLAVSLTILAPAKATAETQIASITVKRGDTLGKIARRHAIARRSIIQLNRLKRPYRLRIGQRLRLPGARYHVVRRGESVSRIARRYKLSRRTIIQWNGLRKPYRLKTGQRLRLSGAQRQAVKRKLQRKTRTRSRSTPIIRPRRTGGVRRLEVRRKVAGAVRKGSGLTVRGDRGPIGKPPPLSGRGFAWPVNGRIIGRFGTRPGGLRNDGVNIKARSGAIVRAAENGVVVYAGSGVEGFGELLLIKHARGWLTAYAHNERFLVRRGQRVRRGQAIARVGSTGAVLRPQLHFEIRKSKRPINPLAKLPRVRRVAVR